MGADEPSVRELAASIDRHAEALERLTKESFDWRKEHVEEHKMLDKDRYRALQALDNGNKRFEAQDDAIEKIRVDTKPTPPRVLIWSIIGVLAGVGGSVVAITTAFGKKIDRDEYDKTVTVINNKLDLVSGKLIELGTEMRISNDKNERSSR